MKSYSVKLRLYKGKKMWLENGSVDMSNSSIVELTPYKSMEWENFMNNATKIGFTDAEVIGVKDIVFTDHKKKDGKDGETVTITTYEDVKENDSIIDEIKSVVKEAFDMTIKVELTPEQKKIAKMGAELAELKSMLKSAGGKPGSVVTKVKSKKEGDSPKSDNELSKWRNKYLKVVGQKPFHGWDSETLESKIEAHGNK